MISNKLEQLRCNQPFRYFCRLVAVLTLVTGCTTDKVKQIGYFAVENLHQQQCQKAMQDQCSHEPSYDEYQRQRQEVNH